MEGKAGDFIESLAQDLTEDLQSAGYDAEVVIVKLFARGDPESQLARWYKVRFVTEGSLDLDAITAWLLEKHDAIVTAEKEFITRSRAVPPDPAIGQMTYDYYALIGAYEAWDMEKGSEEVIVAVIDSGVDVDHPDLANRFVSPALFKRYPPDASINPAAPSEECYLYSGKTYCFDIYVHSAELDGGVLPPEHDIRDVVPHGTPITGIIAANHNAIGVPGIAPRCKILPIKTSYLEHLEEQTGKIKPFTQGTSTTGTIAQAVEYAVDKGADVINLSMSTPSRSEIMQDAIDEACEAYNCIFVAPADNEDEENEAYPAAYNNVIGTTAIRVNAQNKIVRRDNAQYGTWIDVVAPGESIVSLVPDSTDIKAISGTSLSVPFVSGLAALIRSRDSNFTVHTFRQLLRETSTVIDDPLFGEKKLGYGLINLRLALDRLDDHLWDYTSVTQQGNPSSSGTGTAVPFGGFYINPYVPGFSLYPYYSLLGGSGPYGFAPGLLSSTFYPYLQQLFYTGGGLPGGQFSQGLQQPFIGSNFYYPSQFGRVLSQPYSGYAFPGQFYQPGTYGSPGFLSLSPFGSGFQQWYPLSGFGTPSLLFGGFSGSPYVIFGHSSRR
ncbi:MAG: S8 family peptidase [bacterium]